MSKRFEEAADAAGLYTELAGWWPLMSAPADYEEEANLYARQLRAACEGPAETLLELGSGGGNSASHLKRQFELTLSDPAEAMLEVSRALNPECEHVAGDMRTLRIGRQFDLVLVHDAICYMTTAADLRRAIETAFIHLRPGGAALLAPDFVRESFRPGMSTGGHDGKGRALRYLSWTWDPDPSDSTYVVDYAFLLREADRGVHAAYDRHVLGLFERRLWLELLVEAGFAARHVRLEHSQMPGRPLETFVAKRPPVRET
jgi:SAM-dependent methyltransferase